MPRRQRPLVSNDTLELWKELERLRATMLANTVAIIRALHPEISMEDAIERVSEAYNEFSDD